jgi:hypothetical protein
MNAPLPGPAHADGNTRTQARPDLPDFADRPRPRESFPYRLTPVNPALQICPNTTYIGHAGLTGYGDKRPMQ